MPKGVFIRKPFTVEHKENIRLSRVGTKLLEETKEKIGKYHMKGAKIGYFSLHKWVARKLGKPCSCENCGYVSSNSREFHWANISGEYLQDIGDWVRLCVTCHQLFDNVSTKMWKTRKESNV